MGGQSGSSRSPTWRATLWPRARPTRSTSTATAIGSSGRRRRRTLEDSNFARKANSFSLLNILIVMTNTSHRQNWAPYWLYCLGLLERKVVRCLGRVSPGLVFKKKLNLCSSTIINIQVVEGSCESKKCPSQQTCHDLWGGVACYTYWVPFPFGCFINNAKHALSSDKNTTSMQRLSIKIKMIDSQNDLVAEELRSLNSLRFCWAMFWEGVQNKTFAIWGERGCLSCNQVFLRPVYKGVLKYYVYHGHPSHPGQWSLMVTLVILITMVTLVSLATRDTLVTLAWFSKVALSGLMCDLWMRPKKAVVVGWVTNLLGWLYNSSLQS